MTFLPRSAWLRFSVALHGAAVALWIVRPSWWPWLVGGLLTNHGVTVLGSLWPRSRMVGPNLTRIPRAAAAGSVALTFDDGPDPEVTPQVLALLRRRGVRASFFCIGRKAAQHPELVRAIAADGHHVENHSYSHSNLFCLNPPWLLAREIERAQHALAGADGAPRYFRAPAGLRNPWLDGILERRGLQLVSWTRRGFDTVTPDPELVLRRLCRQLEEGDVLLLHDGGCARDAEERPVVLSVLPRLLDRLDDAALRAVPFPRG